MHTQIARLRTIIENIIKAEEKYVYHILKGTINFYLHSNSANIVATVNLDRVEVGDIHN